MSLIEEAMARRSRDGDARRFRLSRSMPIGRVATSDLSKVERVEASDKVALKHRVICDSLNRGAVSAYKMLRTQVVQRLRHHGWYSIGVTAPRAGQGKTLTAINLALSLARNPDQYVFLVDFDLRRHSIAGYLGLEGNGGLLEVLEGAPLIEGLLQYGDQRLFLLLNSLRVEHSAETLAGDEVTRLVEELRDLGGIVIYDLPPLLSADDYLAFSGLVDCTLLVASEGETQRADLLRAREMLAGTNLLGVVLNKSREWTTLDAYYY